MKYNVLDEYTCACIYMLNIFKSIPKTPSKNFEDTSSMKKSCHHGDQKLLPRRVQDLIKLVPVMLACV